MNTLFEAIQITAPIMQSVFPYDCMIGLTDHEKFIYYLPGEQLKHASPVGEHLKPGDGMWEVIHEEKSFFKVIPKEVWGVTFKSVQVPLRDEMHRVIGALGFGYSIENQEVLSLAVESIAAFSSQVAASSQELSNKAVVMDQKLVEVHQNSKAMTHNLSQSDEILVLLNNIAQQSNLLGLNAKLEAARAGKQGLGFSVVADEMRKLSINSADAVKKVQSILMDIMRKLEMQEASLKQVGTISEVQKGATEDIVVSIESLNSLALDLQDLAVKL